ncbi:MFS transporter [Caballeronia pedi]|uniref:MFS transporter n=1 Tax=Caballeronia pedi TaxID=1777141 RepID=UPI001177A1F9|nr:MFS transporter [Caballeronia pedi]
MRACWFSHCSLGTITATGIKSLMIWRFVSGLGLGGLTPLTVAYVAEFCPGRYKVSAAMITTSAYAIGAAGGGLLASFMIPMFGWHSVFILGGVAPVLILVAIAVMLPQSIVDLARRGRSDLVAKAMTRIAPTISVDPAAPISLAEKASHLRLLLISRSRRCAYDSSSCRKRKRANLQRPLR